MITDSTLITNLLKHLHGIDVSKYNASFLNKSIQKRITETHCNSAEEYGSFMQKNNEEVKIFIDSLQISYSDFFRNPLTFAVLERIILPSLILKKKTTKHKEIRIWSTACAAGQESYSLAILLEELISRVSNHLNYRIFATDQSEEQIKEAQKGKYCATALNNLNFKRLKQWFTKHGDTYSVKPELKKNIDFSTFDLFDKQLGCPQASIFGDFDLVICANLLFYYQPKYQKKILEKTSCCLAKGGYIIVGETERDILMRHHYQEVFPQSGIFQIKK
jgi:chemotaxis protein methyltransferase CheR